MCELTLCSISGVFGRFTLRVCAQNIRVADHLMFDFLRQDYFTHNPSSATLNIFKWSRLIATLTLTGSVYAARFYARFGKLRPK